MNNDSILTLKDWRIDRGSDVAIGPDDFQLVPGEIVTVMGPSGVGKTTWLMTILGYEELGLEIRGQRWQGSRLLKPGAVPKNALYIAQDQPFNPNWEVQEFLGRLPWGNRHPFNLLPISCQPRRLKRIHEVLAQLDLLHRSKATVAELSGGESQRAAIAQMLLLSPQLLVGDEFISALDPGMALWILEKCRQQISQTGGAAIIALHDVQTAAKVSDRILLFWASKISRQPWELSRQNITGNESTLYTLLCLARWSKDLPFRDSIRHLVNYLQIWIADPHAWAQFHSKFPDAQTLLVDDSGNFSILSYPIEGLPPPALDCQDRLLFNPMRVELAGVTRIGITASIGSHTNTFTVLA